MQVCLTVLKLKEKPTLIPLFSVYLLSPWHQPGDWLRGECKRQQGETLVLSSQQETQSGVEKIHYV